MTREEVDKISSLVHKAKKNGLETDAIRTILKKHGAKEEDIERALEQENIDSNNKNNSSKGSSVEKKKKKETHKEPKEQKQREKEEEEDTTVKEHTEKSLSHESPKPKFNEEKVLNVVKKAKSRGVHKDNVENILTRKKVPKELQEKIISQVYTDESKEQTVEDTPPSSKSKQKESKQRERQETDKEDTDLKQEDTVTKTKEEAEKRTSSVEYDPDRASLNVNTISVTGAKTPNTDYNIKGLDDILYGEKKKNIQEIDEQFKSENETPSVPDFDE